MSSEIKADKWSPASGTSATIGDSGDTYTVPSGVTLNTSSATLTLPSSVVTGQTAITSLADTDKFLVSDASDSGNLKYVEKQYLPSGGLVFLGGLESSSAASQVSVDNVFSSTYKNYLVVVSQLVPASNGAGMFFKFRDDTPSDISGNYGYAFRGLIANNGNESNRYGDAQDGVQMTDTGVSSNTARQGFRMSMWVQDPYTSSGYTGFHGTFGFLNSSGYSTGGYFSGIQHSNSSPRGVTYYASTGNIDRITMKIYGLVDS
jgi:hypothetical protein